MLYTLTVTLENIVCSIRFNPSNVALLNFVNLQFFTCCQSCCTICPIYLGALQN